GRNVTSPTRSRPSIAERFTQSARLCCRDVLHVRTISHEICAEICDAVRLGIQVQGRHWISGRGRLPVGGRAWGKRWYRRHLMEQHYGDQAGLDQGKEDQCDGPTRHKEAS